MRKLAQLLLAAFCLCLPATLHAQDNDDDDDSRYLEGAVPEVDGRVVFTKEFSIPGMSQDEIYERVHNWMEARLKKNENNSRVVFSDKEKGQMVGIGEEWIIFSSSALSLDRTKISYQLTGSRRVFFPVWYNSFLSEKQYREFHWPYLKYLCEELIKAGYTPLLSLQGTYDHLLETLLELPAGKAIAWFDRTDPVKARDIIGDHMCIAGGISPSLLIGGSVQEIDLQVKKLLTEMKKAPGFIFTLPFNAIGPAKIENVLAMTEAVHRYGGYTQP